MLVQLFKLNFNSLNLFVRFFIFIEDEVDGLYVPFRNLALRFFHDLNTTLLLE